MKRFLLITICLIIVGLLLPQSGLLKGWSDPSTAFAVGDLTVNWGVPEGNPIFTVSNIAPGEAESRTVIVNNGATTGRPVGVRGILTNQTGNIASVLEISISQNGTDLYGGSQGTKTLAQFFTDSASANGISLTTLNPSDSTQYVFKVAFNKNAGNDFQNRTITFDLKIGVVTAIPAECHITNLSKKNIIYGTSGNDIINGTSKEDIIFGLEGNDKIYGNSGSDCIVGGLGNDTVFAGSGNDVVSGGLGNDELHGESGNDILSGDSGNDKLLGDSGNDKLIGGADQDSANGGTGKDTCMADHKGQKHLHNFLQIAQAQMAFLLQL